MKVLLAALALLLLLLVFHRELDEPDGPYTKSPNY
jgi:hypothetical protein